MLSELGRRPMIGGGEGSYGDDFEKEISLLLREQRRQEADDDLEKDLNLYRSGSAPPTVEGSLSAVGGLFNHGGGAAPGAFQGIANNKSSNGFTAEEELRSDPAYLSYYYSNVNLNPRLPPPLLSKEDWRYSQRMQGGGTVATAGGIGDRKKLNRNDSGGGGRSMFSMPPGFSSKKGQSEVEYERVQNPAEWGGDGLIGLPGIEIGGKQKSFTGVFQDDLGRITPGNISRPSSRNAVEYSKTLGSAEEELALLRNELASKDTKRSIMNVQSSAANQKVAPHASHSYAAVIGASLSRSTTPDPQLIARSPSPCLAPIGGERVNSSDRRSINSQNQFNSVPTTITESTDFVTSLSNINLSDTGIDEKNHVPPHAEHDDHTDYSFDVLGGQNNDKPLEFVKRSESGRRSIQSAKQSANLYYSDLSRSNEGGPQTGNSLLSDRHHPNADPLNKMFFKGSPALNSKGSSPSRHHHMDSTNPSLLNYGLGGYHLGTAMPSMIPNQIGMSNMPPLYENVAAASAMAIPGMDTRVFGGGMPSGPNLSPSESDLLNLNRIGNQMLGSPNQAPLMDPMYLQYLRAAEYANVNDPSMDRNYVGNSYMDLVQKAYLGSLLSPQKSQYGIPMGTKSSVANHHPGYYGAPSYGLGLSCPGSPLSNHSPVGPGSPMRHGELNMQFPSAMRNLANSVMSPWHFQASFGMDDNFTASLLDEFKGNKSRCFELSEIAGHVVEFSSDQYGSRFIQQKLETATVEEKNMVFEEIFPEALTLMTDVFGNYVIQKFFEHGMPSQRRELANKLFGHVLTLSLQMYGCRVIQKAIEVVDLDQKINMVQELEGHVMRCVRDQNGNHVIQKCIECVPEENIQFIVSTFSDQVVTLSTHPYGCRVVQRILEHCQDLSTQSKVMDEILGSVSMLAQDQYGNYVIQHVLEHGKPHERSTIIEELAGKIVQMSQQKFASNVVEKCLTFGGPSERQLLVSEMLGSTDENEPLQAMMKDQFANYVVQKVLETCDDQQREHILSRIKVHLNALKKYTYGKHIVARVEKLVAAGERRIAAQSQYSG